MNRAILEAELAIRDDSDQPEGRWESVTCKEYDAWLKGHLSAKVHAGLTDTRGEFGAPLTFTLWGLGDVALVSSVVVYEDGEPKKCCHAQFVEAK